MGQRPAKAAPKVVAQSEEQSQPGTQRVEIPADKLIARLQQQRAELTHQLDMMSVMLEQKDEQIAALLAEKED